MKNCDNIKLLVELLLKEVASAKQGECDDTHQPEDLNPTKSIQSKRVKTVELRKRERE